MTAPVVGDRSWIVAFTLTNLSAAPLWLESRGETLWTRTIHFSRIALFAWLMVIWLGSDSTRNPIHSNPSEYLLEIGEVLPERWADFLETPTGKSA